MGAGGADSDPPYVVVDVPWCALADPRRWARPNRGRLRRDIKTLAGEIAVVESQTARMIVPDGRHVPASSDWTARRIGANPPEPLVNLHSQACMEILAACGIPPSLIDPTAASTMRESWRVFLFSTVSLLGEIVAEELSYKFGEPITLTWAELRASDVQGRARAFASMVESGATLESGG